MDPFEFILSELNVSIKIAEEQIIEGNFETMENYRYSVGALRGLKLSAQLVKDCRDKVYHDDPGLDNENEQ